jgi:large subunit ribosomal protein L10
MTVATTARANPAKVQEVEELVRQIKEATVVGIVDVHGIPALQLQAMRGQLRGKADLRVAKNTLIRIALERAAEEKKGLGDLSSSLGGQIALVTTSLNPFRLFKELESTKAPAAAKGGEISPADIWVRAGDTPFKPGPVVADLQKAGIPAAIEKGKVVIKKDKLLVKGGDKIPREVASVLTRLEVYPLIVGLDLRGAYEAGQVYARSVLSVDEVQVRAQVMMAIRHALGLSLVAAYPSAFSIRFLLSKAVRDGLSLSVNSGFPTKESVKFLLAKAHAQALAVAALAPDALDEETRKKLSAGPAPPPAGKKEEPKKKEEEKEVSEEDAAAGLGALFG